MYHLIVPSYAGVFNKRAADSRDGIKIFKSVGFNAAQC